MAAPGRKPKPVKLKLLHGDRKDRINTNAPKPQPTLPTCPRGVSIAVRRVFNDTLNELKAMGTAHAADRESLLCYAEAVITHRRASELIAKSDVLTRGQKRNLVKSPAVQVQRDAAQTIRAFAAEFGLTPASRTRIEVNTDVDPDDNPFAG